MILNDPIPGELHKKLPKYIMWIVSLISPQSAESLQTQLNNTDIQGGWISMLADGSKVNSDR
jgi:hypothetical protein